MYQMAQFGKNKTGTSAAPERAREMMEGMERFPPSSHGSARDIAEEMIHYAEQGERIGSVPPPTEQPDDVSEEEWALFLDKLGERLAFERSGVRLYDGILAKLEAHGAFDGGPEREELERIRTQELEHFRALVECVEEVGGDPTAVTPSADVSAQIGAGVGAVIGDPRSTLVDCLEAILVAELTDNEAWENLISLARAIGREEYADRFEQYSKEEDEHLDQVRHWLSQAHLHAAPGERH